MLQSWGLLLGVALFCGVVFQLARPSPLPWTANPAQRIATMARFAGLVPTGVTEARMLVGRGGVVVVDARSQREFSAGHIRGALSLPNRRREQIYPGFAGVLPLSQPLLVYCGGENCAEALELGRFLVGQGHENVHLLLGGFEGWQRTAKQ